MDFFVIKKKQPNYEFKEDNFDLSLFRNSIYKLDDLIINKNIGIKLKKILSNSEEFGLLNLFIYGDYGTGKYTLAELYINEY